MPWTCSRRQSCCIQLPPAFLLQEVPPAGRRSLGLLCLSTLAAFQGNPFLLLKPKVSVLESMSCSALKQLIPLSSARSEGSASLHPGAGDMGSKLSMPGGDPTAQSPRTEGIHDAYKRGDPSRARHLLREACDESTSQLEKVRVNDSPSYQNQGPQAGQSLPFKSLIFSLL